MNPCVKTVFCLAWAATLTTSTIHGQIVSDGATNTLSNITNSINGEVIVGTNGSFTLLILSNNSLLTNSLTGIIGRNATARSNEARLTGASARWMMGGDLFVGTNGSFSRLTTDNGGRVEDFRGWVAVNTSSSNNVVTVTGSGSSWTNRSELYMGYAGSGNEMIVSNGGRVFSGANSFIGNNGGANSNLVIVSGAGSQWEALDCLAGNNGSFNRLLVENGGVVTNRHGYVGFTGRTNAAWVIGTNSLWFNTSNLAVGVIGGGNLLAVSNGATAHAANDFLVGVNATANSNTAIATGPGTRLQAAGVNGFLVGSNGSFNQMIISNGAFATARNSDFGLYGSNNTVTVTGSGSTLTNANFLTIGGFSTGNRLIVGAGATVINDDGRIGSVSSSSNNEVVVSGPGATWNSRLNLQVGASGNSSRLVVSNGGTVMGSGELLIGANASSINNRLTVHGGALYMTNASGTAMFNVLRGSNVFNAGLIDVDRLVVTNNLGRFRFNGGTLVTRDPNITGNGVDNLLFWIGTSAGSEPAVWDVRAGATNMVMNFAPDIGRDSSFNSMLMTNGAVINGAGVVLGELPTAHSNSLVLSGGSKWLMSGFVSVGATGACNRVMVSEGAAVSALETRFSYNPASTNNEAVLTGVGSVWTNTSVLELGYIGGGGNRFVIADGGVLVNSNAFLGHNQFSANNEMLVTGAGSLCINSGGLHIGEFGAGNRLIITNGGRVVSREGFLGAESSSRTNEAIVTGPGTEWQVQGNLVVGFIGEGNLLVVSNGASVSSTTSSIILGFGDTNRIIVDDSTLRATNGFLSIGGGTNIFVSGLIDVNTLSLSGTKSVFEFHGGTLRTRTASILNAQSFVVGDTGAMPAIWDISGASVLAGPRLPDNSKIVDGTYNPTDFGGGDSFPAPAPAGPYNTNFSSITGTPANGIWSLYIVNDTATTFPVPDKGALNSWSLQIQTSSGAATSAVFSSTIHIPTNGAASIYPATITVGGISGLITKLTVTLSGYHHSIPDEVDVLLVGPAGQKIMLMSDVGGSSPVVSAVTLVFDDDEFPTEAVVSPPLIIGQNMAACQLLLTGANAALRAQQGVVVGLNPASTGNRVVINGGRLRAVSFTNASTFEARHGTNVLNAGSMDVDRLLLTNSAGVFEFNGGTLVTRSTIANNGRLFSVGNGFTPAVLQLPGGTHFFSNGLEVPNNSSLVGNGSVSGAVSILNGGLLTPGPFLDTLILSNSPVLQGTTLMEISRNGMIFANDRIQVSGTLNYGGSLIVSNLGPSMLAASNRFQLFTAGAYAGGFSSITLPQLPLGLEWASKLLVDGSIEVVIARLRFSNINLSGTNVIVSGSNGVPNASYSILSATNLTTPVNFWDVYFTSHFDGNGGFSITNPFGPGEFQRYFRVRMP